MINITLSSKEDVHKLKHNLREVCETLGLRLGKSNQKPEAILAGLFGYKNYNILLGLAARPDELAIKDPGEISFDFVERVHVPSTTYGAADVVKDEIRRATGIRSIILAVRDGKLSESATTVLLVASSGAKLIDGSLVTAERTARELELLDIFHVISERGCLGKSWYTKTRVDDTQSLPSTEAANRLSVYALSRVFPDWPEFLATFNKNYERYGEGVFLDDRWNELAENEKPFQD